MAITSASFKQIGKISLTSLAIASALYSASASAQLTQNITLGNPKALALGHAVTADPPGIDSIHFNPAGLAKIQGRQQQLKVLAAHITYDAKFGRQEIPDRVLEAYDNIAELDENGVKETYPTDPVANTTSSTADPVLMLPGSGLTPAPFLVVPFGGIAIEDPNYGWTFATAAYSPQAIGYERAENDPGSFQGQQVGISRITYFAPSVGFHFSDELMIGASIGFSWQGLGIKTKFRAPDSTIAFIDEAAGDLGDGDPNREALLSSIDPYDTVGTLQLELEDALSLSFNLGVLWEPTEWIAFGFVYQSEAKADLEGDFSMNYNDEWLAMIEALKKPGVGTLITIINEGTVFNGERVERGNVSLEYILPAHMSFGTSIKVLPDLKVNLDFKWVDYAAWDSLDFKFSQNVDFLSVSNLVYQFGASTGDGDNADPDLMIIKRDYESVWSWAIGFEYEVNDNLVVRWGYEPRESVIPDNRVDLLAPIAYADLYTVGFGYQLDAYSRFDVGFGYLHSEFDAAAGESQNMNSNLPGRVVYNPYAFLSVEAETNAYIFALSYDSKF